MVLNLTIDGDFKMDWIIYFALMTNIQLKNLAINGKISHKRIGIFYFNCSRYWLWRDEFGGLNEIKR